MARKLQRVTLKEGQRRSLRISTMVVHSKGKSGDTAFTHKIARQVKNDLGPASRTRGRKKRKLRPVEELTISPAKQQKKQCDEDIPRKNEQPSELTSAIFMPEKHILELILNILQRRDTYEIFAEPVDPKEVEDYYDIIDEPMDFGTMRAKLHEEKYKSLEQFEHDVFLIFNNAMHFNSSGTLYFRQARTMNELAKKVFNVLKVNPENFEREFSETIQRDGRRNQKDFKDSANVELSESSICMSSEYMAGSSNATPFRKSFKSGHERSDIVKHVDARVLENPTGPRKGGRYRAFEVDRRCTYRPYIPPSEDKSIFQTIYGKLNLLEQVNQQDIGYRESLMLFVKDIGQKVKNIVRRKLSGHGIHTGFALAPLRPNAINANIDPDEIRRASESTDLEIASGDKVVYVNDDIYHDQVEGTLNAGQGKAHNPLKDNIQGSQSVPIVCDRSYWPGLDHSRASADKLNCLAHGCKEVGIKPTTILSDKSKSNIPEHVSKSSIMEHSQTALKSRFSNKCESIDVATSSFMQMQNMRKEHRRSDQEYVACSFEAGKILQSKQTMPPAPSFVFNLPYLRTRLDQINSSEHYSKGGKKPCSFQLCFAKD